MNESEYHRAVMRLSKPLSRRIQNGSAFRMGLTWGAGFALVMGCGLVLAGEVSDSDDFSYLTSGGAWFLAGFMLVMWLMMGAMFIGNIKTDQAALAKLRADVDAYELESRRRQDLSTTDDDWEPFKSTRQMQHEWYGHGNSDLNWRDRELGEALGIENGDVYKNNLG